MDLRLKCFVVFNYHADLAWLSLYDEELYSVENRGLTQNFDRGIVHFELFVDDVALFVEGQDSFIRDVDHDLFFAGEVHLAVMVSALLPKNIDDGRPGERLGSEKVEIVSLPDLESQKRIADWK